MCSWPGSCPRLCPLQTLSLQGQVSSPWGAERGSPWQDPGVFGAAGGLVPLQSFLAQGGSRIVLALSWHPPQDKSAGGAKVGQGIHSGAFCFQPLCPEGRSGPGFHLGLDGLGLHFLISQTSALAQVLSEAGPCSYLMGASSE